MFTPILMTFAGDDDATRAVAEAIAATLDEARLETEVRPLQMISGLDAYGAVVLGGPMVDGHWDEHARAFLRAHRTELTALPVAVFAVAPQGDDPDGMENDRGELLEELAHLRWLHPIAADLFRKTDAPIVASSKASQNGHMRTDEPTHAFDSDRVHTWARWLARVLQPAAR